MSTPWWRRNRLWLALLLPALALALAASAFRLTTLYLPFEWSAPTNAGGPTGTLRQTSLEFDDRRYSRTVEVTVQAADRVPTLDGSAPIPGASLWRVDLGFAAAPDQLLAGTCTVQLKGDDGAWYGFEGGRVAADPDDRFYRAPMLAPSCVPEDTPGPDIEAFTGEFIPAEIPRPERWSVTTSFVIPAAVTPTQLRIGWSQPEHLVLQLPR